MLALRTRCRRARPDRPPTASSADGLAERRDGRVVLTPPGRLLANEATTRLLGALYLQLRMPLSTCSLRTPRHR